MRNRLARMYQGVVTLAYYTGWRINSEILTLEWRQIDRAAGVMRLEPGTTKNREGRIFKYAELDEVVAAIEGLWARHEALEASGVLTPLWSSAGARGSASDVLEALEDGCTRGQCPWPDPA